MLAELDAENRLLLLKFLCAFAWTDLELKSSERGFIERLMSKLELSAEERAEVGAWMHVAPAPDSIDPKSVPAAHRATFLNVLRALIYVDGDVDPEEREHFERLKAALSD
jgi:uncharacterized tellurite resistance protein B-like protein